MTQLNPNDPALPIIDWDTVGPEDDPQPYTYTKTTGLSIRAELAARAMQGMLTSVLYHSHTTDQLAAKAVKYADALIVELNK